MTTNTEESNKALVLEAFDTLFNKHNYEAAARFWSPNYIQHSAHIEPGREGLFNLVRALPPTLKYQPGVIAASGDYVIIHGRFSGFGAPRAWIAADVCRISGAVLVQSKPRLKIENRLIHRSGRSRWVEVLTYVSDLSVLGKQKHHIFLTVNAPCRLNERLRPYLNDCLQRIGEG
jgi:predicted SnoaL-like aldol condensation-catalyzing enzyme